jgi:hypothetical protein
MFKKNERLKMQKKYCDNSEPVTRTWPRPMSIAMILVEQNTKYNYTLYSASVKYSKANFKQIPTPFFVKINTTVLYNWGTKSNLMICILLCIQPFQAISV